MNRYRLDPKRPGVPENLAAAKVALEKSTARKRIDALMADASKEYKAGGFSRAAEIWLDVLQVDPTYPSARAWLKLVGRKLEEESREPPAAPARPASPSAAPLPGGPSEGATAAAEEFYRKGLLAYSGGDTADAIRWLKKSLASTPLRQAQQALEQCQTEMSLTVK